MILKHVTWCLLVGMVSVVDAAVEARAREESPVSALIWNMTAADAGAGASGLAYDDRVTAFAAQGLSNRGPDPAFLLFDIGNMNFDWPEADQFWAKYLVSEGRASFSALPSSLCGLLTHPKVASAFSGGMILYEESGSQYGDGFTIAIALTMAGQRSLLPVSSGALERHGECLSNLQVAVDLRKVLRGKSRLEAWGWAIEKLLPRSSKSVVFNLNHYRVEADPTMFLHDKQSNATRSSIDYIVQQNAFVLDLESHSSKKQGETAPWNKDDELIQKVMKSLVPLFDAYGWSDDEFSWTNETTHAGGTIMCSFASPNLSFWAQFPLLNVSATHSSSRARKLPENDRGLELNRSKYYVTFETNEGDTPRILVSNMASTWAQNQRGSIPVAWGIDPLLAERFPSLFDYYASTATVNDTFIAGTSGAGYAYMNQMSDEQIRIYGKRAGRLSAKYGPRVFDTYGYANLSTHVKYAQAAAEAGGAPTAFVTQPNWGVPQPRAYDSYRCDPDGENVLLSDGRTPLICTPGEPNLFYYSTSLDNSCPSCDLAKRIMDAGRKHRPPHFVTVYGGLQAGGALNNEGKKGFWNLLGNTVSRLDNDFTVIGATEMARLVAEAVKR